MFFMLGVMIEYFAAHPQYWKSGNPNVDSMIALFSGLALIWLSVALLLVRDEKK
jgi:hypothetical protein